MPTSLKSSYLSRIMRKGTFILVSKRSTNSCTNSIIIHFCTRRPLSIDIFLYLQMKPFEAAYANIKTKTMQMEERNIYCGAYFTTVLLNKLVCSINLFLRTLTYISYNQCHQCVFRMWQRGQSSCDRLQRWIIYGHRLQGPCGAFVLCGIRNNSCGSVEGPRWQHTGSAALWGARPADDCELWCKHQVRCKQVHVTMIQIHNYNFVNINICFCTKY